MNAQFILPEFNEGAKIYPMLFRMTKDYPEIIRPNTEIYTIYGIFPGCIWNGGGATLKGSMEAEDMAQIIGMYNYEFELPLTFNFTNALVEKEHFSDSYGNLIAALGNNGKNYILTANEEFEAYLRDKYPNYNYCRSILATEREPYLLKSPSGEYLNTVIQRSKNNDWDYLNTIPMIDREKIEFLCNDQCPDNCPRIYSHYKDYARAQLKLTYDPSMECTMFKEKGLFSQYHMRTQLKTYISRDMIDNEYLPKGFNKFKCAGRGHMGMMIANLFDYIIKPEYHDDFITFFLGSLGIAAP